MKDEGVIVAVITAREGSKGVVDKNLRKVGGVSLVGRAISSAIEASIFDKIILTTDGHALAEEGRKFGADIVLRPKNLSGDSAKSIDAVLHAIEHAGIEQGTVVLLQPTSPLRNSKHIIEAVEKFNNDGLASLASVCEAEHHPYKSFLSFDAGLRPISELSALEMPRQDLVKAYRLNGAIFVNDIECIRKEKTFYSQPLGVYEMDAQSSIDIDSEIDLKIANAIIGEIQNA